MVIEYFSLIGDTLHEREGSSEVGEAELLV